MSDPITKWCDYCGDDEEYLEEEGKCSVCGL